MPVRLPLINGLSIYLHWFLVAKYDFTTPCSFINEFTRHDLKRTNLFQRVAMVYEAIMDFQMCRMELTREHLGKSK